MMAAGALACTLTSTDMPPTIVPRQTAVPPPTIGYATLAPTLLPDDVTPPPIAIPSDPDMLNLMNEVEADRLMIHVRAMVGVQTRHINSPQNRPGYGIGAARDYIQAQFEQVQAETQGNLYVFPHQFIVDWNGVRTQQTNIVAIVQGDTANAGVIIVGAHYDSRNDDLDDAVGAAYGANDNGSGIAALMELARILAKRPHRATLMFVAFSGEEEGRKGSTAFVQEYVQRNNLDVRLYINLDAVGSQIYADGRVDDRRMRVFSKGPNDSSRSRQMARLANLIAFNYVPEMEILVQDAYDRDGRYGDHFSFEEAGYPAIRLMEMAENSAYLDSSDVLTSTNPHPSYLQRSTQTMLVLINAMADSLTPPRNISLRDNGNGTRTLIWEPIPNATGYLVALRQPNSMIYQQFETNDTSVTWDGFTPTNFTAVAVGAKNENGIVGMLSDEWVIR